MPRCANCGKANREGALFCQECGQKIDAAPPPAARKPAAAPASARPDPVDGPLCPACGVVNPPGMHFCKMCGTGLGPSKGAPAAAPAQVQPPPAAAAPIATASPGSGPIGPRVLCTVCGSQTPTGFAFCQHCGQRLATPSPELAPTMAPPPRNPGGGNAALAATMAAPRAATGAAKAPATPAAPPAVQAPPRDTDAHAGRRGRLVVLRRDGSDGESHPVVGEHFDIGRSEGQLLFADDPFLAARHVRLSWEAGALKLKPIDRVNGVYVRVGAPVDLHDGDLILIGKELLRFAHLLPEERDPPILVEHGVRVLGTVQREAWGRLEQRTCAGTLRDLWHMVRPDMVLGREEGDVTFPDDEYMSRRHAALRRASGRPRLEDLGSSNGTFVRVRSEHELRDGDVLRLGEQLVRFER